MKDSLENKLFKINHVFLESYAVMPLIGYHIILLIEFLQQLFFMFYQVDIKNEFKMMSNSNSSLSINVSTSVNSSTSVQLMNASQFSDLDNENDLLSNLDPSILRVDYYLQVFNFPLYILETVSLTETSQLFIPLYYGMNAIFLGLVIISMGLAERYFKQSTSLNNGGLKEGSRIIVRLLAFIMKLYLTVFQVPMFIIYF